MVIQTRYRDVPWEEVRDGFPQFLWAHESARWPKLRGTRVAFENKPDERFKSKTHCKGPFFRVIDADVRDSINGYVCPHIAEIGD